MYINQAPVRHTGFMDWTREKGPRMCWQFWFDDGSSVATFDTKLAFKLANMEMNRGTSQQVSRMA